MERVKSILAWIETQEQVDWLLNGIENGEIAFDNRKRTKEEWEEIRNERCIRRGEEFAGRLLFGLL